MNDYSVRSGHLCAVCHRKEKLSSRREYCTGRPCYQMYLKHLEIQQQGGGRDVEMSVTEPGASASAQPPFQQGGRDVEASVTEPAASANGASSTGPGASAWVPPRPRPPPLPPATKEMAEVVGMLKTVLTELTVLKGELTQVASDIQELKDQVRVLADAANDMVQPQRAWRSW